MAFIGLVYGLDLFDAHYRTYVQEWAFFVAQAENHSTFAAWPRKGPTDAYDATYIAKICLE